MMRERGAERLALEAGRATEKVNAALRQGFISPARRDWALDLCRSDTGAFDSFLAASGPVFSHLFKSSGMEGPPPASVNRHESAAATAICAQLGLPPGSLKD